MKIPGDRSYDGDIAFQFKGVSYGSLLSNF